MVADEIIYAGLAISAATLALLVVFFLRVGSLINKKVAEIASKIEQANGAVMSGVSEIASKFVTPAPPVEVERAQRQEPPAGAGIVMEGGLGGEVGPGRSSEGMAAPSGGGPEALQPGKRYKYVMDPVTRKMKLVPAD